MANAFTRSVGSFMDRSNAMYSGGIAETMPPVGLFRFVIGRDAGVAEDDGEAPFENCIGHVIGKENFISLLYVQDIFAAADGAFATEKNANLHIPGVLPGDLSTDVDNGAGEALGVLFTKYFYLGAVADLPQKPFLA